MFKRSAHVVILSAAFALTAGVGLNGGAAWAEDGGAELPATEERINYSAGHVWIGAGLGASVVSIASDRSGSMLALSTYGAVYLRKRDGSWREVLGPTSLRLGEGDAVDEETLLLDAEGFMDEIEDLTLEDADEAEAEDSDDETSDEESPADRENEVDDAEVTVDEVSELYLMDEQGDGSDANPRAGGVVWLSDAVAGLALVSRADGLWRSTDGGETWSVLDGLSEVHVFSDAPGGLVLAGTPYGRRFSRDQGESWHSNLDPISSIEVFDFATDERAIYAGTEEGLFRSPNGLKWAKVLSRYDSDVPIWTVAIDRHWEGGLWVAGPVGVLRSDDGGEQLRAAGRNMLAGTRSLLALESPGHLLAAGVDGVWESRDGGTLWRPIVNGLPSPTNHWLANGDSGPVIGGADGVFHLKKAKVSVDTDEPQAAPTPEGADMGTLTVVALNRPGMAMSDIVTQGTIARALLLPKLTIRGDWYQQRMLRADYDWRNGPDSPPSGSNNGHFRTGWSVGVAACFGGCGSTQGLDSYEDVGEWSQASEQMAVVGDEVYNADGEGSLAPMAANVAERVTRYRTDVANRITELVIARHRLIEARAVVQNLSLKEQVSHELDISESTARLDVYTNGYFSRVLEGS